MDLGTLRTLAVDLTHSAHGVPATVTRPAPDDTPIVTRVIWRTPMTEEVSQEFSRREPRRVLVLNRADVPTVTVKPPTRIVAPPRAGATDETWRVDAIDRLDAETFHVVVVPEP